MRYILLSVITALLTVGPADAQLFRRCQQPMQVQTQPQVTIGDVVRIQYYWQHLNALKGISENTDRIATTIENAAEIEHQDRETLHSILREQMLQRMMTLLQERQTPQIIVLPQPTPDDPPAAQQSPTVFFTPTQPRTSTMPGPMGGGPFQFPIRSCPGGTCYSPPQKAPELPTHTVAVVSSIRGLKKEGTGTHIGNGYILTCAHILRRGWQPTIVLADGKVRKCKLIGVDAMKDLALLSFDNDVALPSVPVIRYQPTPEEPATMEGVPISTKRRTTWRAKVAGYFGRDLIVQGVVITQGASGGPMLVRDGLVSVINEYKPDQKMTFGPCNREVVNFVSSHGITVKQ